MAIIGLKKGQIIPYVPEADRMNDTDPCTVHIRYVPNAVVQDGARKIAASLKNANDPKLLMAVQQAAQKKQFVDNVVSIENYSIDGRAVTTAEEFYEAADVALIQEIIRAMENADRLTEGQRKNSLPASATASSDGARTEAGVSIAPPAQTPTGS
jgi:hypothetical protein